MNKSDHILLFDGICNLCNGLVRFIIRRDRNAIIRFAPLQSSAGKYIIESYGLKTDSIDTVVYISGGKVFIRSSAVLHLLKDVGHGWQMLYALIIIPEFIRDFIYNFISDSRYRIFGKTDTCMVPKENINMRFL